jgi:hypothetical protein
VEALIGLLDVIDGDPDFEDSEASLNAIDKRGTGSVLPGRWIMVRG